MVKHTQTIHRLLGDELFECVWPFCGVCALRVNSYLPQIHLGAQNILIKLRKFYKPPWQNVILMITKQQITHVFLDHMKEIYKTFFKKHEVQTAAETKYLHYLYKVSIFSQSYLYSKTFRRSNKTLWGGFNENDLYKYLKIMQTDKSLANNKLTKEP